MPLRRYRGIEDGRAQLRYYTLSPANFGNLGQRMNYLSEAFIALLFLPFLLFSEETDESRLGDMSEFVSYAQGNLPVILLAPHGGNVKPEGMPVMPRQTGRDVGTAELAKAISDRLMFTDAQGVKRRPHLIINHLHRSFVEPNRSWSDNLKRGWLDTSGKPAGPHQGAERLHRAFHASAASAVKKVESEYKTGVLLDLHGLSLSRKLDMYGYLLRASDLHQRKNLDRTATDAELAQRLRERSSIRTAASGKKSAREITELVRGSQSLASLVDRAYRDLYPDLRNSEDGQAGRPATPSARFPNPKGSETPDHTRTYFNGAYDIFIHSSRQAECRVDAIQIELTADARNTKVQRARFARCMARALRQFLRIHYGLKMDPPGKPASTEVQRVPRDE